MEWHSDPQTCPVRGLCWRAYAQYTFPGPCLEILIIVGQGGTQEPASLTKDPGDHDAETSVECVNVQLCRAF